MGCPVARASSPRAGFAPPSGCRRVARSDTFAQFRLTHQEERYEPLVFELQIQEKAHLFEDIWDIRTMGFVPKPEAAAYASVVQIGGVACTEAAMFDDIARNLVPARILGMTTIWLKTDAPWGKQGPLMDVADGDIDHQTDNLTQFLHSIRI